MDTDKVEIYFDGAANNHIHKATGKAPMGVGVYCLVNGVERFARSFYAGYGNSMEAEWCAFIIAMKVAVLVSEELRLKKRVDIVVYNDNEIVVKQWNGDYDVTKFSDYYKRVLTNYKKLRANCKLTLKWIPRELNTEADRLSKIARTNAEEEMKAVYQMRLDLE